MHLLVQLENGQRVYFTTDNSPESKKARKVCPWSKKIKCVVDHTTYTLTMPKLLLMTLISRSMRADLLWLFQKSIKSGFPTHSSARVQCSMNCRALRLLEDDAHWDRTLQEAAVSDSPLKTRSSIICRYVSALPIVHPLTVSLPSPPTNDSLVLSVDYRSGIS